MSSVGKLLGVSNNEKIEDAFLNSASANLHPPDASAHISSHNAVRTQYPPSKRNLQERLRARQLEKLERNYQKAVARAGKKGHKLPPREQYYDHWGYQYYSE